MDQSLQNANQQLSIKKKELEIVIQKVNELEKVYD